MVFVAVWSLQCIQKRLVIFVNQYGDFFPGQIIGFPYNISKPDSKSFGNIRYLIF